MDTPPTRVEGGSGEKLFRRERTGDSGSLLDWGAADDWGAALVTASGSVRVLFSAMVFTMLLTRGLRRKLGAEGLFVEAVEASTPEDAGGLNTVKPGPGK